MSSMTFNQKVFKPVPPDNGSFPLDHEGVCKNLMIKYLRCLWENDYNSSNCRDISKSYLNCRMDNSLMARADWSDLGFGDLAEKKAEKSTGETTEKKQ